ncbi:hypothetical protein MXB_1063 [Myxobolus squamalis]|nr:hypothetical protein MXB_1063 [Myxobolus squamalis]
MASVNSQNDDVSKVETYKSKIQAFKELQNRKMMGKAMVNNFEEKIHDLKNSIEVKKYTIGKIMHLSPKVKMYESVGRMFWVVHTPDNALYSFNEIYEGCDPAICIRGVCTIGYFIGEKLQTFPASATRFFDPNFMPCGLEFKIIEIAELDANGVRIPFYTSNLNFPQPLFYTQPNLYNFTYCNPQLEISSTSSTAFPFGQTVTDQLQAEFYPQLNCTPVNAFLSSSQVYITNGSRLDNSFGAIDIDVSVFTTYGNMVNQAKNQSQFVMPGDVMINFTLSRFEWSGNVPCTSNKKKAESLLITFYIAGEETLEEIDRLEGGYGCNIAYDLRYGGVLLRQRQDSDCEAGFIGNPNGRKPSPCL